MANINPFKAVRPTRDKVSLVASRSYQSYTQDEREARLDYNPFSFLHIVNPGYKYHKEISGKERYGLVRNRYLEFKEDDIFVQDESPCFYIYRVVNREQQVFTGIVAAASTEDYKNNVIKKHEDTIEYREQVFKEYLKTVGFNAEPVLLTYPDSDSISSILAKYTETRAEFEFTTTYRDTHYLWLVEDANDIKVIQDEFARIGDVYIADGHHRSASSFLLSEDAQKESYRSFMSYLIPESELRIYEFNRLIKDLNGLSKEQFLLELDQLFRIENRGLELYKPSKKHHFSMYLDGEFYSLYLRKTHYNFTDSLSELDTHILYITILKPILGITDLRNDSRIDYGYDKHNVIEMKNRIDSGEFAVGFGLVPVNVDEMKRIADEGLTMPPKSTYIEPKLRSGVTIYEF
ncbi:uncharacterized protein (DUF1015 family) [Kordia periserrulae]|uniref:Uncharacterized protein (DUF1015 family) n=1 Tax=Kordia periserrulae TaxID=701523 RepID=A0A2T6BQL3_9FLAO|nr:DUF1015 domain-containing protein [Kordia periserrulae]PTX58375.1 uncharacterized protein (DUF1015 family) [Kordia periserrulae]